LSRDVFDGAFADQRFAGPRRAQSRVE
jgi:hypothetical protein